METGKGGVSNLCRAEVGAISPASPSEMSKRAGRDKEEVDKRRRTNNPHTPRSNCEGQTGIVPCITAVCLVMAIAYAGGVLLYSEVVQVGMHGLEVSCTGEIIGSYKRVHDPYRNNEWVDGPSASTLKPKQVTYYYKMRLGYDFDDRVAQYHKSWPFGFLRIPPSPPVDRTDLDFRVSLETFSTKLALPHPIRVRVKPYARGFCKAIREITLNYTPISAID